MGLGSVFVFLDNPDLADILGDMEFDFDKCLLLFFGFQISGFPNFPTYGFPVLSKFHTDGRGRTTDRRQTAGRAGGWTDGHAGGKGSEEVQSTQGANGHSIPNIFPITLTPRRHAHHFPHCC